MTVATARPGHHHFPVKPAALACAGAVLSVGAGFAIANLALDDEVLPAEPPPISVFDQPGYDPNGFAGTNREERALQHRG
jgi:hypothetical protein